MRPSRDWGLSRNGGIRASVGGQWGWGVQNLQVKCNPLSAFLLDGEGIHAVRRLLGTIQNCPLEIPASEKVPLGPLPYTVSGLANSTRRQDKNCHPTAQKGILMPPTANA